MLRIGNVNHLQILHTSEKGVCLDGLEDGEIWLPAREAPSYLKAGEILEVFAYYDSKDALVATTKTPFARVGGFACLQVTSIEQVGAFLDWNLPKELFLPFREQTHDLRIGDRVVVFLYIDNTGRISASMRIHKYIDNIRGDYRKGQAVDLLIASQTDLGFNAVINDRHLGVLYKNEIFHPVETGQRLNGFIKHVREDGKIDLSFQQTGHLDSDETGKKILALLERRGGFLPVGDKAPAEVIYDLFGVSKKKYKMAIGILFKKQLISLDETGIRSKGASAAL